MNVEGSGSGHSSLRHSENSLTNTQDKFGLKITYIEDNSVLVRDAVGVEVAFEWPLIISMGEYEAFLTQMMDSNRPLPSLDGLKPTVIMPLDTPEQTVHESNLLPFFERHALIHKVSAEEMERMYNLARQLLYDRFKSRLRDKKPIDT